MSVCALNITLIIIINIIVHACFSVVIVGDGGVPSVLKAVPVGGVVALVRIAAITGRFPRPGKPRRHFPLSFSLRLSRDAGFSREAQRVPPMMAPLSPLSFFFVSKSEFWPIFFNFVPVDTRSFSFFLSFCLCSNKVWGTRNASRGGVHDERRRDARCLFFFFRVSLSLFLRSTLPPPSSSRPPFFFFFLLQFFFFP